MNENLIKDDETLDDLQLKDLFVIQKKDKFRFGVDAVLLANFANVKSNSTVIDLCSGTGIVPFVIKGKNNPSKIIGLEIQEEMVEMAQRSVLYNKLENKIDFIKGDLKNIEMLKKLPKADVVTVNPPYKVYNSGIINPDDKIAIARHEICCNLEDVILACRTLLKDNKRMYMVHRPDRLVDIFTLMRKYKIEPKRVRMVHPNVNKAPNIVLIEAQRDGGSFLKWESPLFVYDEHGNYTEELTRIYGRDK
ncbi:tRNA1(Val) (adenine(37)-N6)-methyltransferase [Clostridium grantii]|uniref:tRNA1(Val) A37 N6-methylase TrmN6 n=1 Tax=Clostridium grantii DSM 8605 TaxID=1121316 RepID=A0A1M5XR11_9CLOT|nr:tRNA1(Val) (adenine(37)-N6)-methyltransferase [Clostridium grantii]SHI02186.1 tRNA1(Val) A37 N6-methylase TrmN6 [Clostridium grantii DSM 8605]